MLSVSQDGLLREMLLSKYRLQIFDYIYIYIYIYTISNTSSFEINWVFLVGGQNYPPLFSLGWGPVSPCFLRPLRSLTCLADPSNNSNL